MVQLHGKNELGFYQKPCLYTKDLGTTFLPTGIEVNTTDSTVIKVRIVHGAVLFSDEFGYVN